MACIENLKVGVIGLHCTQDGRCIRLRIAWMGWVDRWYLLHCPILDTHDIEGSKMRVEGFWAAKGQ